MPNANRTNKGKNKEKGKIKKKYGQDGGTGLVLAATAAAIAGGYVGRKIAANIPKPLGGHDFNRTGCSGSETFQCNYYTNNYIRNYWQPIDLTVNCTGGDHKVWTLKNF
jgi:hypothetical protein